MAAYWIKIEGKIKVQADTAEEARSFVSKYHNGVSDLGMKFLIVEQVFSVEESKTEAWAINPKFPKTWPKKK